MANRFWTWVNNLIPGRLARAQDLNVQFQGVDQAFKGVEEEIDQLSSDVSDNDQAITALAGALSSHTSNAAIHRPVNDGLVGANNIWSALKTNSEIEKRINDIGALTQDVIADGALGTPVAILSGTENLTDQIDLTRFAAIRTGKAVQVYALPNKGFFLEVGPSLSPLYLEELWFEFGALSDFPPVFDPISIAPIFGPAPAGGTVQVGYSQDDTTYTASLATIELHATAGPPKLYFVKLRLLDPIVVASDSDAYIKVEPFIVNYIAQ